MDDLLRRNGHNRVDHAPLECSQHLLMAIAEESEILDGKAIMRQQSGHIGYGFAVSQPFADGKGTSESFLIRESLGGRLHVLMKPSSTSKLCRISRYICSDK